MLKPSATDDGWWLTNLWVGDDEGVVQALAGAPAAGPPPGTPLEALGPTDRRRAQRLDRRERRPPTDQVAHAASRGRGATVGATADLRGRHSVGSGARGVDDAQPAGAGAAARFRGRSGGPRPPGLNSHYHSGASRCIMRLWRSPSPPSVSSS